MTDALSCQPTPYPGNRRPILPTAALSWQPTPCALGAQTNTDLDWLSVVEELAHIHTGGRLDSLLWGLGFGVWGLGFGVWGLGFGVWGLEFGFWVWG